MMGLKKLSTKESPPKKKKDLLKDQPATNGDVDGKSSSESSKKSSKRSSISSEEALKDKPAESKEIDEKEETKSKEKDKKKKKEKDKKTKKDKEKKDKKGKNEAKTEDKPSEKKDDDKEKDITTSEKEKVQDKTEKETKEKDKKKDKKEKKSKKGKKSDDEKEDIAKTENGEKVKVTEEEKADDEKEKVTEVEKPDDGKEKVTDEGKEKVIEEGKLDDGKEKVIEEGKLDDGKEKVIEEGKPDKKETKATKEKTEKEKKEKVKDKKEKVKDKKKKKSKKDKVKEIEIEPTVEEKVEATTSAPTKAEPPASLDLPKPTTSTSSPAGSIPASPTSPMSPTSPTSPTESSKSVNVRICKIIPLEEKQPSFEVPVERDVFGQWLFDKVWERLGGMQDRDYFGLSYLDKDNQRQWLELGRNVHKQLKHAPTPLSLKFRVKHYPQDPLEDMHQEMSRYFLYLQLRRDLLNGRLLGDAEILHQLAAYAAQAEFGDYEDVKDPVCYMSNFKVVSQQTAKMEESIVEMHQTLSGLTAGEAETEFINRACKLDTYGVTPFQVKDQKGAELYLGLTHEGVVTFQGSNRVHIFKWPDILKLDYDGKTFIVHATVREESSAQKKNKHSHHFKCDNKAVAAALWRWAVDRQLFFTLNRSIEAKKIKSGGGLFRKSHTFRFGGRTQKELLNTSLPAKDSGHIIRSSSNPDLEDEGNSSMRREDRAAKALSDDGRYATFPRRTKEKVDNDRVGLKEVFEQESTPEGQEEEVKRRGASAGSSQKVLNLDDNNEPPNSVPELCRPPPNRVSLILRPPSDSQPTNIEALCATMPGEDTDQVVVEEIETIEEVVYKSHQEAGQLAERVDERISNPELATAMNKFDEIIDQIVPGTEVLPNGEIKHIVNAHGDVIIEKIVSQTERSVRFSDQSEPPVKGRGDGAAATVCPARGGEKEAGVSTFVWMLLCLFMLALVTVVAMVVVFETDAGQGLRGNALLQEVHSHVYSPVRKGILG